MNVVLYVLLVIGLFIAWLALDLYLGRKKHLKEVKRLKFPKRQSDILLYSDGNLLYKDLYDDMRKASHHIHSLFYMVRNDHASEEFLSILKEKADQGVEVRLLLDYFGSFDVKKETVKELKSHGIEVEYYHKPAFPFFFFSINQRNHRKITVVDGKIGYLGGFNIGKEYLGQDPEFGVWRDYHLKLEGEGVQDLQSQFMQNWEQAGDFPSLEWGEAYFPVAEKGPITHKLVPTNGGHLSETFLTLLQRAEKSIIICTPYFIPSDPLLEELLAALGRGVKVTVLVPAKADHPLVMDAAFPYFKTIIGAGAEVYRFYLGFYHAKVMVIDDHTCDIGTANFDKRSLFLNNEINCLIFDKEFVHRTVEEIHKDIHNSEKLTLEFIQKRSFMDKSREQLSKILSPLM
ncbi:cardiolipin synthase [Sutcliffiella horikoshii]|uniref:cardiolipin synthase n=1 Tax=Sutcliffiella horikoshii TaxID=79883 RepID=UPI001EED5156|nr:cardiolipin synthase [Sutcliffiella horikoshii]MCG1021305.1 cardiolipin synthase [Sutcliffiella horikoshii]